MDSPVITAKTLPADEIIANGRYFIVDDYARRKELDEQIRNAFLDGLEKLHGKACREAVAVDGLAKLHLHFPVQKVRLLEAFLMKRLRDELYYWTYAVSRENLGLENEFFVDNLIVFRIHYPYEIAKSAKNIETPPPVIGEKIRIAAGDLRNRHMIAHRIKDFKRNKVGRWLGVLDNTNSYSPEEYHGNIPRPARSHGPHIDTWYGHSFDGINLWLAVDGVNEDNTVILYPEMFGNPVEYDPVSMYIKAGNQLTKPVKHAMKPGQLLIFNPELLHGTQVNISDETRVALTTRLNPDTPRFNTSASFHFQHWRSSNDLEKKQYNKITIFPASQYSGKPSIPEHTETLLQTHIRVQVSARLENNVPVTIGDSDDLPMGQKMAVNLRNAYLLVARTESGLVALNRRCPHRGVDLIDGHHDDEKIYCPGHGIAFDLRDGKSPCDSFTLKTYSAEDKDGKIIITKLSTD